MGTVGHGASAEDSAYLSATCSENQQSCTAYLECVRNNGDLGHKGLSKNNVCTLLLAPRPAGKARATSIPGVVYKERATQPAGRSPKGYGGGRASAALPLLDDVTTSPASRRLASARPALAPKCKRYSLTGPNLTTISFDRDFDRTDRGRKEPLEVAGR